MNADHNKAIICIAHAIVLNNAGGTSRALVDAGYEKTNYLQACEIELRLLQVFLCDRKKFFQILNSVSWNYGEQRTNVPEIKDKLIALTNLPDTPHNKGDWWKHVLILLNT